VLLERLLVKLWVGSGLLKKVDIYFVHIYFLEFAIYATDIVAQLATLGY